MAGTDQRIDDLARALARPMPRRRALALAGGAFAVLLAPGRSAGGTGRASFRGPLTRPTKCPPPGIPCQNDPYFCRAPGTFCCPGNPNNFCAKITDCCAGGRQCCDSTRGQFCCNHDDPAHPGCCDQGQRCVDKQCIDVCPAGHAICGKNCCEPGQTCVKGECVGKCGGVMCKPGQKCCASTKDMPRSRCYDPASQCCTPVGGVLPKRPLSKPGLCPDRKPKPGHRPTANGCGPENGVGKLVPNTPIVANFKSACDYHDICYETCKVDKSTCDAGFLDRMLAICKAKYGNGFGYGACASVAQAYHGAVADLGDGPYDDAQKAACDSCC